MPAHHHPNAAMQETTPAPELNFCPAAPSSNLCQVCGSLVEVKSPSSVYCPNCDCNYFSFEPDLECSTMPGQHQSSNDTMNEMPAPSTAPECHLGRCPICGINPVVSRVFDGKSHGFLVQGFGLPESCRFCNFELRSDIFSTLEDAKKAWYWKVSGYNRKYKEFFNYVLVFYLILASICITCGILGIIDFFK